VFVRIERMARRSTLNADLGTNEIRSDAQSRRDPLINLAWSRSVGARSTLGLSAAQGFTGSGGIGTGSALVTGVPFEQETVGVRYDLQGARTRISVGIARGEEDYAGGTTTDNDYQSTDVNVAYSVSSRLNIGLRYELYDREYEDSPIPTEDRTAGFWLDRTLGRRFSVALDVSRFEATGSQRVEEERWEIRFAYSPTGHTASAMESIGR
jgi:hypothetical protein